MLIVIWALAGFGTFWPAWAMFGLALALGAHAIVAHRDRLPQARERELVERVDELTRTRRGALDVQAAELRRIERDLHDGAQARLVALSMLMGRAEERLDDRPRSPSSSAAPARRRAPRSTSCATSPAGIAPPVLADRGLQAAIEALASRSITPVTVEAHIDAPPAARGRDGGVLRRGGGDHERRQARRRRDGARDGAVDGERTASSRSATTGRAAPIPRARGSRACGTASRRWTGRWRSSSAPGGDDDQGGAAMRVVIVEDNALLREGVVALLRERDIDVVAQAEDGPGLLRVIAGHKPDLAIVDVRLAAELHRRGTARRDRGARAAIPGSRSSSCPSTSSPSTRPSCWPRARAASATCSRSGWGTSARSSTRSSASRRRHGAGPRGRRRSSWTRAAAARAAARWRRSRRASARSSSSWPRAGRTRPSPARWWSARARWRSTSRASSASSTCPPATTTTAACWRS